MKALITYEWNGKKFTNPDRLVALANQGKIRMSKYPAREGYATQHVFHTHQDEMIASFTQDNSFGYSTQACAIELK